MSWIAIAGGMLSLLLGAQAWAQAPTDASRNIQWREHWIDDEASAGIGLRGADGLAMSDLDRDGFTDVISVHEDSHHVRIAFASSSPRRWLSVTLAAGAEVAEVEDVAAGDLNGDGFPDIVLAMESGALMAFVNPGSSARQPQQWRAFRPGNTTGRGSFIRLALADFDRDGKLEIIASNKGEAQAEAGKKNKPGLKDYLDLWLAERRPISVFKPVLDESADTPWPETVVARLRVPINAEPVDLDGDGDVDVVAGGRGHQGLMWLENREGIFHPHWLDLDGWLSVLRDGIPFVTGQTLAFADMNGDGRTDILTQLNLTRAGWLEQPGDPRESWKIHVIGSLQPDHVAAIQPLDVDRDGALDVFLGSYSKVRRDRDDLEATTDKPLGQLAWFRNLGNAGGWQKTMISRRVRGMYDEFVAVDLDRDQDLDLVGTRGNSGEFDGLFWLEQVRSGQRKAVFTSSRLVDSAPALRAPLVDVSPAPPEVKRLLDGPIIHSGLSPSIGENIQGPSLIRVPDWVPNPLGTYYLYFADHKGSYIRLAYADELTGPWHIHEPGSLQLADTGFPQQPLSFSPAELARAEEKMKTMGLSREDFPHDLLKEFTTPHVASPDVHVDDQAQRIIMYFHGLQSAGRQVSRVAVSTDGIHFDAFSEDLGRSYMRSFQYEGYTYALAMPGQFYRSQDGLTGFEPGPVLFDRDMRHSAVMLNGKELLVFWTRVGDEPERILLSRIDISGPWMNWKASEAMEVMRPTRSWEGADAPLQPSKRSVAYGHVNQLRDPAIYREAGNTYLLYAVAGESGIGIAQLFWPR